MVKTTGIEYLFPEPAMNPCNIDDFQEKFTLEALNSVSPTVLLDTTKHWTIIKCCFLIKLKIILTIMILMALILFKKNELLLLFTLFFCFVL